MWAVREMARCGEKALVQNRGRDHVPISVAAELLTCHCAPMFVTPCDWNYFSHLLRSGSGFPLSHVFLVLSYDFVILYLVAYHCARYVCRNQHVKVLPSTPNVLGVVDKCGRCSAMKCDRKWYRSGVFRAVHTGEAYKYSWKGNLVPDSFGTFLWVWYMALVSWCI